MALLEGECHCGRGIKIYILSLNFATKLKFRITEDRGHDSVSKTLTRAWIPRTHLKPFLVLKDRALNP